MKNKITPKSELEPGMLFQMSFENGHVTLGNQIITTVMNGKQWSNDMLHKNVTETVSAYGKPYNVNQVVGLIQK